MRHHGRLIINQNWHGGWKSNVGNVVSDGGRLAVELPEGEHRVTLRFVPRSAVGGFLVSAAAFGVVLGLVFRQRRRPESKLLRASTLGLVLLPLAVGGLSWVVISEDRPPAPILRNANGSPVFVTSLPDGVAPLPVSFSLPVRLEGARVGDRDAANVVPVELYWRTTGPVPRSIGVFVHFEPARGREVTADHQAIGASLFLSEAPTGQLLRDAFGVQLPAGGGTWRMYVGLWHAGGDQDRVPVDAASVPVVEHRVLVQTFELGK
jgi:hypothetical protein